MARIDEAKSARNQDQLRNLLSEADSKRVSDQTVLLALLNAYFDLTNPQGMIKRFERFRMELQQESKALTPYAWALGQPLSAAQQSAAADAAAGRD